MLQFRLKGEHQKGTIVDISPVIPSSSLQSIIAASNSQRVVFSIVTPATTSSTSVDISGLGQLLSSASLLKKTISKTTGTDSFSAVLAAAQLFVDAFNGFLQSDSLQNSSGASLSDLLVQALHSQATDASAQSILTQLSGIGITYQPALSLNSTAQMTVDLKSLQSAYLTDQTGTLALLTQAAQSIGQSTAAVTTGVTTGPTMGAATTTPTTTGAKNAADTASGVMTAAAAKMGMTSRLDTIPAATVLFSTIGAATVTGSTVASNVGGLPATQSTARPTDTSVATASAQATAATQNPAAAAVAGTVAPTAIPLANPIIDASDPAIAAAIAAYHIVDGIFDVGKSLNEGLLPAKSNYSEIWPVAPASPVSLNLHP